MSTDVQKPSNVQKPSGVQSTRETWSLAIKYVAERKRIEEALGFIVRVGETVSRGPTLAETVATLKKLAVPYLADVVYVEVAGEPAAVEVNAAVGLDMATAAWLRTIAWEALDGDGAEPQSRSSIALRPEPGDAVVKAEGAVMRVPLAFRGRRYGSATFVKCTDDVPKYSKAHLAMAAELGRGIACALRLDELAR
jgi:hypothetical protein